MGVGEYAGSAMARAVVAGHICLDVIPGLLGNVAFEPGRLYEAGPVTLSTGGAVANAGLALAKLGIETRLVAKVGDDSFGRIVREILESHGKGLGGSLSVGEAATSYSVVLSPPGRDRTFLHCPGSNDAFTAADVSDEVLGRADLMHFGYPPLMARMYERDGEELVALFSRAKRQGLVTSLDLSLPDPDSPSGSANWLKILERVLPYVDIFLPSIEELRYCLDRDHLDAPVSRELVLGIAGRALRMGASMVGIKLGASGLYLKTSDSAPPGWTGRSIWQPCYSVDVRGTTGSGDTTIAGFLAGFLKGQGPEDCCQTAAAVGACCCESSDAVSGVRDCGATQARIGVGWKTLAPQFTSDEEI